MLLVPRPQRLIPETIRGQHADMDLLLRPDLLSRMAQDLDAMGTVGETDNKQVLFLAMVSRLLPRPVNVVVKGPSSSGKSHLVRSVAELFGLEAVLQLSTMSPRALYYMADHELRYRVLFFDEYMAHAGRDHALRLMQSEGRLVMAATLREVGGLITRTRTVEGPIAFVTTTTRQNIFDENETRAFSIQTDGSEAQTERIHDALRLARTGDQPAPHMGVDGWRAALARLLPHRVIIPFAESIHLASTGQTRDRRDLGRILSLVEASALLHQMQRRQEERGGRPVLVADLEDYRVAYRLAGAFLAPSEVTDSPVNEVVAACQALGASGASHYDLMDILSWSRPTVIKYCQQAVSAGRMRLIEGARHRQKRYVGVKGASTEALTPPRKVAARYRGRRRTGDRGVAGQTPPEATNVLAAE